MTDEKPPQNFPLGNTNKNSIDQEPHKVRDDDYGNIKGDFFRGIHRPFQDGLFPTETDNLFHQIVWYFNFTIEPWQIAYSKSEIDKETYEKGVRRLTNEIRGRYRIPPEIKAKVDKLIEEIINFSPMPPIEKGGKEQPTTPTPLGVQLHQQLETADAYSRIEDPQKRQFLQEFLKTNKSIGDITRETNGVWSLAGVRNSLYASMRTVFPFLPRATQTKFDGQAEKVMKSVIGDEVKKAARREKIKAGWQVEKPRHHTQNARKKPGEGRRTRRKEEGDSAFSDSHRQQITNANLRRWASYHAEKEQAANTTDQ